MLETANHASGRMLTCDNRMTVSMPASTRPNTGFTPSSRGTGPGPVVM